MFLGYAPPYFTPGKKKKSLRREVLPWHGRWEALDRLKATLRGFTPGFMCANSLIAARNSVTASQIANRCIEPKCTAGETFLLSVRQAMLSVRQAMLSTYTKG